MQTVVSSGAGSRPKSMPDPRWSMSNKILRIVNVMFSTSNHAWGTEHASYRYAQLLLRHGHHVLFVHKNADDLGRLDIANRRLQCHRLRTRHFWDLIATRKIINAYDPDIIIVHNHFHRFMLLGIFVAPMVGVAHLGKFGSLKHYDGIIVFNPHMEDLAKQAGIAPEKIGLVGHHASIPPPSPPQHISISAYYWCDGFTGDA